MRTWRVRTSVLAAVVTAAAVAVAPGAGATGHVEIVVEYEVGEGELPEGVAVDKRGNVFVSVTPLGRLDRIAAGSSVAEPFGQVPGLQQGDLGLIGVGVDAPGDVYATVAAGDPAVHGIWRFDRVTGEGTRIPGTEVILFPNALAFGERGILYVTDTILGAVWRIDRHGDVEPWIVDDLLAGDGSFDFGFPIGANGIAVHRRAVHVGVTETWRVVSIPILPDGSAGEPEVMHQFAGPVAVDGIALDVHGKVYVADPLNDQVIAIGEDGATEVLATAADDGLDRPTSLAFGTGRGTRGALYVVSFSAALGFGLGAGPSVALIDVGVPGAPLP